MNSAMYADEQQVKDQERKNYLREKYGKSVTDVLSVMNNISTEKKDNHLYIDFDNLIAIAQERELTRKEYVEIAAHAIIMIKKCDEIADKEYSNY